MTEDFSLDTLKNQAYHITEEFIKIAGLYKGQLLVIGCSTSEVLGHQIGSCLLYTSTVM